MSGAPVLLTMNTDPPPVVLCISGHDPVGGAGIQADIEAVAANGCYACTAITCLTVQDSCDVAGLHLQPVDQILSQVRAVLDDVPVAVIKIGLLGSEEIALALSRVLQEIPPPPIVLDPVLAAGGGASLADAPLLDAIRRHLLPLVTLLTPNSREARLLAAGPDDLGECAQRLLALGCGQVLIMGAHEDGPEVINRLYTPHGDPNLYRWERLPGSYHGSGCTLASSIAARLALASADADLGARLLAAVQEGQAYTWQTLSQGLRLGRCQYLPNRLWRSPGRGAPTR